MKFRFLLLAASMISLPKIDASPEKKKIVILSCDGGGGHAAASRSLTKLLGDKYDTKIVNIVKVIGTTIDPVSYVSGGYYGGEDVYNYFLRNQWSWTVSQMASVGKHIINWKTPMINKKVAKMFEREKPDMFISTMPLFNHALYNTAEKKDIPFLVLTTDLDSKKYVNKLKKPKHSKFRYALAFDDPMIHRKIRKAEIGAEKIVYPGFPLRADFFERKDKAAILKKFNLPNDRPIILLMMGAAGSKQIIKFARKILSINRPLHLVACVGRNKSLKKKIKNIKIKGQATVTALGFTQEISDLMAVSTLLVSKPGPNTLCEAMQMQLPILLDHTAGHIKWEKLNFEFVKKNDIGLVVNDLRRVPERIERFLDDATLYTRIKKNLANMTKNRFPARIRSIVDEMFEL